MNIRKASHIIDTHFAPLVGQTAAKTTLKEILLGAVAEDGFMPGVLLGAPKGIGKTTLMKATKGACKEIFGRKNLWFESGKGLGDVTSFFERVLIEHFNDKEAMLFCDEVHEANEAMQNVLRGMMEPSVLREAKAVKHLEYSVNIHPCMHGIFLATNKLNKVDPALQSRLERIDLALYSDDEMEQILFRGLDGAGITFNEDSLRVIAQCNRGTARDVVHWVNAVRRYVAIHKERRTVNKADVATIIRNREAYPLGISKLELRTLLILEEHGDQQLRELAGKNGGCSSEEQQETEKYLMARGLMTVDSKRKLLDAGKAYLKMLREEKYLVTK